MTAILEGIAGKDTYRFDYYGANRTTPVLAGATPTETRPGIFEHTPTGMAGLSEPYLIQMRNGSEVVATVEYLWDGNKEVTLQEFRDQTILLTGNMDLNRTTAVVDVYDETGNNVLISYQYTDDAGTPTLDSPTKRVTL